MFRDCHRSLALALPAAALLCWSAYAQVAGSTTGAGTAPAADKPVSTADANTGGEQRYAVHAQTTIVVQGNAPFRSRFTGPNSLKASGEVRETFDVTGFVGLKPWGGAEIWANPEIDQGFGLRNTLGAAGFTSGEAYKVGKEHPYFRLPRLFLRQTLGLGGASEKVDPDLNQLGGRRDLDRIVLTVGKFSVGDVFDTNTYAHDPRADFLNWTVIEAGTFDYAADAWGYTLGAAAELYKGRFAARAGLFNLSTIPNSAYLSHGFEQYELVGEIEERHTLHGRDGKIRLTGFINHGNMARLDEAVAAAPPGIAPDPVPARHFASRPGISINIEQTVSDSVGVFARAGFIDGRYEAFEFTDVDQSVSAGVSIKGNHWHRPDDRFGLAVVANHASDARRRFQNVGGLGILVGDGALPHPGDEYIVESYYAFAVWKAARISLDAQGIANPAYNRDRGPVALFAARFHAQF